MYVINYTYNHNARCAFFFQQIEQWESNFIGVVFFIVRKEKIKLTAGETTALGGNILNKRAFDPYVIGQHPNCVEYKLLRSSIMSFLSYGN